MKNIYLTRKYKVVLCPKCDTIQVTQRAFICSTCNNKANIVSSGSAKFPLSILNSYHARQDAEEVCEHLKKILRGDK